ncbi:T-cell surface antigen CD2 isoform X1 [Monodelphis domestica]|uniref:T-cell surface antigen CD2 isoform X1 n=1 Tax=Monodelphis domestica TaxID=13616 RepID=UPI0024E22A7A|nr:T-cell surface antigen CD2 isoform X1 [Monodelphis domestica]
MNFLVAYLILLFFPPRGAMTEDNVVWGALTQSISLDIPHFQQDGGADDIRWSKGQTVIAMLKQNELFFLKDNTTYEISANGTLKIKELTSSFEGIYKVSVYHKNGTNLLEKTLALRVMKAVSQPVMTWDCTKRSVVCEVQNETNAELTLFDNGTQPLKKGTVKSEEMRLKYTWPNLPPWQLRCVVKNKASEKEVVVQNPCTEKVLDIYHILSICGGGMILLIFLLLLIFCFQRRKKQKTNDQNLEINISRVNKEERGRKLHQNPDQRPQVSGGRHPQHPSGHCPQAPGHHLQVPGHRPPVPCHRPQQQQQKQKRPSPKVPQQTGPPLPRPRNQPKPPHQEKGK